MLCCNTPDAGRLRQWHVQVSSVQSLPESVSVSSGPDGDVVIIGDGVSHLTQPLTLNSTLNTKYEHENTI